MRILSINACIVGLMLSMSTSVQAGPYTDDLGRCLVESTTVEDKVNLVKWMFTAASVHPAVSSIASVTEAQLDDANRTTAEMFVSLLTETCKEQTQKAIRYEGQVAIEGAFRVLGQVAAKELFTSPEVSAAMSGLQQYLDSEKLRAVLVGAASN